MAFRLISDWGRGYPSNGEIVTALGLKPGHHLPNEFRHTSWLGKDSTGALTYIEVMLLDFAESKALHPHSSKPRRIHAKCPECDRLVCAGHTIQHKCKL